jgi:hypothetical protein
MIEFHCSLHHISLREAVKVVTRGVGEGEEMANEEERQKATYHRDGNKQTQEHYWRQRGVGSHWDGVN